MSDSFAIPSFISPTINWRCPEDSPKIPLPLTLTSDYNTNHAQFFDHMIILCTWFHVCPSHPVFTCPTHPWVHTPLRPYGAMPLKWLKGPRIVLLAYTSENVVEKINEIGNLPCLPSELLHKRRVSHLFASGEKPSRWDGDENIFCARISQMPSKNHKQLLVPLEAYVSLLVSMGSKRLQFWQEWSVVLQFTSWSEHSRFYVGVNELSSRDPDSLHESLPQGNFSDHFFWKQMWDEAH